MADESMALLEGVRKAIEEGDGDFLLEAVNLLAQGITEAEMAEQVVRPLAFGQSPQETLRRCSTKAL
jgi:hypothetical protein